MLTTWWFTLSEESGCIYVVFIVVTELLVKEHKFSPGVDQGLGVNQHLGVHPNVGTTLFPEG